MPSLWGQHRLSLQPRASPLGSVCAQATGTEVTRPRQKGHRALGSAPLPSKSQIRGMQIARPDQHPDSDTAHYRGCRLRAGHAHPPWLRSHGTPHATPRWWSRQRSDSLSFGEFFCCPAPQLQPSSSMSLPPHRNTCGGRNRCLPRSCLFDSESSLQNTLFPTEPSLTAVCRRRPLCASLRVCTPPPPSRVPSICLITSACRHDHCHNVRPRCTASMDRASA